MTHILLQQFRQLHIFIQEPHMIVEAARLGIVGSGAKPEKGIALFARPLRTRLHQCPSSSMARSSLAHRQLPKLSLWNAGKMPAPRNCRNAQSLTLLIFSNK